MKILTYILALMILALNCVPCMDGANEKNTNNSNSVISKSSEKKQSTESDSCSPFCTCNCCPGFTFVNKNFQLVHPFLCKAEKIALHLPFKITNIALPIWQPPQLG